MKKLLFTICLAILPALTFAQYAKPESKTGLKPQMKFETEVIDYGTIKKNADGVRYFKFENTGSAPLIIKSVKGSCGCTVPTKPEKPVMPGQTGEIKVKYATNRVGRFTKTVTIVSNATEKPKVVRIKGEVLKE
ncbi:DUF1573 domain-containing protein [Wenyingzhuangia sp. IMCC45574]